MIQELYFLGQKSGFLDEDLPSFNKLSLLERLSLDRFEHFLFTERFVPFTFLKILIEVFSDTEFAFGYEKVTYVDYTGPEDDVTETPRGNCFYPRRFSSDELIELLFFELQFSSLDSRPPLLSPNKLINAKGVVSFPKDVFLDFLGNVNYERRVIFATDSSLILTEDAIYCRADKKDILTGILSFMEDEWKRFLKEDVYVSVNHEKYISILMKLFPGRVRLKTLGHN